MTLLDRILRRRDPAPSDPHLDELERLLFADVDVVNVRFEVGLEPVLADLEVVTDWGPLVVRDVGLRDPDGAAVLVYPWIGRPGAPSPDGSKHFGGYVEAVQLPDALRRHVRNVLLAAWNERKGIDEAPRRAPQIAEVCGSSGSRPPPSQRGWCSCLRSSRSSRRR